MTLVWTSYAYSTHKNKKSANVESWQSENFNNVLCIMLAKYNNIDSTDLFSDIHGHRVACVKIYIDWALNKTKCVMHCPSETNKKVFN